MNQPQPQSSEYFDTNIYSAEMTAWSRCAYPDISCDNKSQDLVTALGAQSTVQFMSHFNYPLFKRLVSVRAGFFFKQGLTILKTGAYDGCISIASGFSLLTYLLSQSLPNTIQFIDCDVPNMMEERKKRLSIAGYQLSNIAHCNFDVLSGFEHRKSLQEVFPSIHRPLFILEGLSYFLPKSTLYWLLDAMSAYSHKALIFDYCSTETSLCLERLRTAIPEYLCGGDAIYASQELVFTKLSQEFQKIETFDICGIEQRLFEKQDAEKLLINQNEFIPTNIIVAEANG